jgi:hypothetical protein
VERGIIFAGGITIEVRWDGPHSWPTFESENNLRPIPREPGVYLSTFEYQQGGYLILSAGFTRRTFPKRFKEHARKYMNGEYSVLDIAATRQGVRKKIWIGWKYARTHPEEFEERKSEILHAARKQLAEFRIFTTHTVDVRKEARVLERLEAAIMGHLYQQPSPICDMAVRGMRLLPRRDSENPIIVRNNCAALLHGLPALLEI